MARQIKNQQAGFVLLISTIIIAAVLTAVIFSVSFRGFYTRFNLFDSESKERSLALAEACGQIAVLKRIQSSSYTGNETLPVGTGSCQVLTIDSTGSDIIIRTKAEIDDAVSNIQINLNSTTLAVIRWREVPNF